MSNGETRMTLTDLQAAQVQLERAVVLFLDDGDFVSALTRAGAAELLLGKLLVAANREPIVENYARAISGFNIAWRVSPPKKRTPFLK
jgi:hypothetical protein